MKKLTLEDQPIINNYLDLYQIEASELSFTNLYAWRDKYQFHYVIFDDFLWIINVKEEHYYLSQPIGDYDNEVGLIKSIESMRAWLKERPFVIKKADERFVKFLDTSSITTSYEEVRDDFDYLYDFEKMKTLSGNKYHKKKNHVNQFLKKYSWNFDQISEKNLIDIEEICKAWFEEEALEWQAIKDVLKNRVELEVSGGVLYIEDKPVGFIIGQKLNSNTLVIHFEKGIQGYHGIYPMVFYQYIQELDYTYINREQDLGIEGLRKSKLSYHPLKLIRKHNVRIL